MIRVVCLYQNVRHRALQRDMPTTSPIFPNILLKQFGKSALSNDPYNKEC